jgi:hypothetical protein
MSFSSKVLRLVCFVLALLLLLSTSGCSSADIWGIPKETFLTRIKHRNVEFLRHINYDKVSLKQVFQLGESAGYYMSFVYKELGLNDLAEEMLELQWDRGPGAWKRESAVLLLSSLVESKQYLKAEEFAKRVRSVFPNHAVLCRLHIESMYWQEKTGEVLKTIEELAGISGVSLEELFREDPEMHLYYAATMCELEKEGWQKQFLSLFTGAPASMFHVRGHDFLLHKGVLRNGFTAMEKQFIEGKYNMARGYWREAFDLWEPLFRAAPGLMTTDTMIKETARLFSITGEEKRGAALLTGLGEQDLSINPYILNISLGRLESGPRNYHDAALFFKEALEHSSSGRERDIALWLHMDALFDNDPLTAAAEMDWYVTQWVDPSYYHDILEELCSFLVREKDWTFLLKVYNDIRNDADPVTELRYRSAIVQASEAGLLNASPAFIEELHSPPVQETLFDTSSLYYTFLFSRLPEELTERGVFPTLTEEPDRETGVTETSDPTEPGDSNGPIAAVEQFISGFMQFGLYEEAYNLLLTRFDEVGLTFCRQIAEELAEQGHFYESVVIMKLLFNAEGYTVGLTDYNLLYPQPYYSEMRRLSVEQSLPLAIFYGLVREESHFKAAIVSHAGAVGLAQMMPSTAEHVAMLMRKKEYELTNPSDNLEMGAFYFNRLMGQFDVPSRALYAYNAGPNRVRSWEAQFGDLPGPLFLEAIPFKETRHYGRKVLVSALYYAYLYENKLPDEIISSFFKTDN